MPGSIDVPMNAKVSIGPGVRTPPLAFKFANVPAVLCAQGCECSYAMIAILEAYKANLLKRQYWPSNLIAGLIVGIVALPLAMAFAIASGAKPGQGIYSAIIAGTIVSLFGGSRIQIAGPTGAFIVILAGITAKHGIDGLLVATLMAGIMLILLGAALEYCKEA